MFKTYQDIVNTGRNRMAKAKQSMTPHEKFLAAREAMNAGLIEREQEVDICLTALLCREHPLFVGPPGTAKSMMLDGLMAWMNMPKFDICINKHTTPEELFGPISVMGLKNDEYRRVVTGMLPEARGAFIDEIFKAGSSILNTLLKILNERIFYNSGKSMQCPLEICVSASNEWPNDDNGGKELGALFDRFLFRRTVQPVQTTAGRKRLLWGDTTILHKTFLEKGELMVARQETAGMDWNNDAVGCLENIIEELRKEGITPGDRRQKKSVMVCQAYSWLNGHEEVEREDLEILQHVLWDDPAEQPKKCAEIVCKWANPAGHSITTRLAQIQDIVNKNAPAEAVPKLKAVLEELKQVPSNGQNGVRRKQALEYAQGVLKEQYDKVVGL